MGRGRNPSPPQCESVLWVSCPICLRPTNHPTIEKLFIDLTHVLVATAVLVFGSAGANSILRPAYGPYC